MRIWGAAKILLVLAADFLLLYFTVGVEIAAVVTALIMLYAWLGEYIAMIKDRAVAERYLSEAERAKLLRAKEALTEDVKRVSGANISGLKLRVVPSNEANAFAYGFSNVAISRAALGACDDMTLRAVLGHEAAHVLSMDPVFNRAIFANVTVVMLLMAAATFVSTSFIWIIFLLLCLVGACGGLFSVFIFRGALKAVKWMGNMLQRLVVFIYQTAMGLVSRGCEFRADSYSAKLGYGQQLCYFLSRFIGDSEDGPRTLTQILYDSHPPVHKRIERIAQHSEQSLHTLVRRAD